MVKSLPALAPPYQSTAVLQNRWRSLRTRRTTTAMCSQSRCWRRSESSCTSGSTRTPLRRCSSTAASASCWCRVTACWRSGAALRRSSRATGSWPARPSSARTASSCPSSPRGRGTTTLSPLLRAKAVTSRPPSRGRYLTHQKAQLCTATARSRPATRSEPTCKRCLPSTSPPPTPPLPSSIEATPTASYSSTLTADNSRTTTCRAWPPPASNTCEVLPVINITMLPVVYAHFNDDFFLNIFKFILLVILK